MRKLFKKASETLVGTFCISFSATLASAPLSILFFGLLAPLAVFLNMVLMPLASLVIVAGLFAIITGYLQAPLLCGFFNHGPLLLILLTGNILEWVVQTPGSFIYLNWHTSELGYTTVFLFLGSLLIGHGLQLRRILRFSFPVVLVAGMILLNTLIQIL